MGLLLQLRTAVSWLLNKSPCSKVPRFKRPTLQKLERSPFCRAILDVTQFAVHVLVPRLRRLPAVPGMSLLVSVVMAQHAIFGKKNKHAIFGKNKLLFYSQTRGATTAASRCRVLDDVGMLRSIFCSFSPVLFSCSLVQGGDDDVDEGRQDQDHHHERLVGSVQHCQAFINPRVHSKLNLEESQNA